MKEQSATWSGMKYMKRGGAAADERTERDRSFQNHCEVMSPNVSCQMLLACERPRGDSFL